MAITDLFRTRTPTAQVSVQTARGIDSFCSPLDALPLRGSRAALFEALREQVPIIDAARGELRDFVAVGDVGIRVIGADNQFIDTEIPVRQILEQIVAKLGIPPFILGLSWSTTERMSRQQADIFTSELESYRKLLSPVLCDICGLYLRLHGFAPRVTLDWGFISLQDETELASARLTNAQAEALELENAQHREVK